jgi:hypothetical protein
VSESLASLQTALFLLFLVFDFDEAVSGGG